MKKSETHFLKVLMIESFLFFIIACTGIFCIPFFEAKQREKDWVEEENIVSKNYYSFLAILNKMMKSTDTENLPNDYQDFTDTGKMYMESVKLEKEISAENELQLGTSYIKIKKQAVQKVWGQLEHEYLQKKVSVLLYGESWEKLEKSDMTIFWKKQNSVIGTTKEIPIKLNNYRYWQDTENEEIRISKEKETIHSGILLEFNADKIFSYQLLQDEDYVYITFRNPKAVYDKIVVVDAGHGGKDTGTYAKSGNWDEKDFNLDFVKKIQESWNHDDIKLYFSRLEDTEVALAKRVKLANDLQADLFVSLHCNSSDENSGSGMEALYKNNFYLEESKTFAKKCMKALEECTGLTNRGLLKGNRIYIIRNAKVPTVLLELGFLSDIGDLRFLSMEDNRQKIAETICQVIWETFT